MRFLEKYVPAESTNSMPDPPGPPGLMNRDPTESPVAARFFTAISMVSPPGLL